MYRFDGLDPFAARRAKLQALIEAGVNPYPPRVSEHLNVAQAREQGNQLAEGAISPGVGVAGRIMALRGQGALFFIDLRDQSGNIQLLLKKDSLNEELFDRIELLDLGDFIWVHGPLFITKRGELTVEVQDWQILSKALRPLPDLWKGLQDIEQRQRQRYAELIVSDTARERFTKRSLFVQSLRRFLEEKSFLSVETPVLEPIPGGADAEPFITHHNALDVDFYLRISLELYLKRLVVGGLEKVYELGPVFRNEGISPQHLQEFTMLEVYWAYSGYQDMMTLVEQMYAAAIEQTFATLDITRGEDVLHFQTPWPRVAYVDLFREYLGFDVLTVSDEELLEHVKNNKLEIDLSVGRGRLMDQLYKKAIRPHLKQPQFVIDIPVDFSPLAKRKPEDSRLTERFLVLIGGTEVGNAFTELNDPIDQRSRFEEQEKLRAAGDTEAQRLDEDYLRAMEYGMPPISGFGVSIERLLYVLMDVENIRETVFFPTMRPEEGQHE